MDNEVRDGIDAFVEQAVIREEAKIFLKRAVEVGIPREDGPWLKSMFKLAVTFLASAFGSKNEANRNLPWLLFSLGMAYERYYQKR